MEMVGANIIAVPYICRRKTIRKSSRKIQNYFCRRKVFLKRRQSRFSEVYYACETPDAHIVFPGS